MSGKRLLLDTNAIIALLNGNRSLLACINSAEWIGISIISRIEFLAFPGLSQADSMLFEIFLSRVNVIDISNQDQNLISEIIRIRKQYKVKLPDAIISATSLLCNAILITEDKKLLKIKEVTVQAFEEKIK